MTTENNIVVDDVVEETPVEAPVAFNNTGSKSAIRSTMRKHSAEFTELPTNSNEFQCGSYYIILGEEHIAIHNVESKELVKTIHYGSTQFKDLCLELVKLGAPVTPARGGGNTAGAARKGGGASVSASVNTLRQVLIKNGWSAPKTVIVDGVEKKALSEQLKGEYKVITKQDGWELLKGETSIISGLYGRGTSQIIKEKTGTAPAKKEKKEVNSSAAKNTGAKKAGKRNKPLIEKEEVVIPEPEPDDSDMNEPADVL